MSRRSHLSRRMMHRPFLFSRSCKDLTFSDLESVIFSSGVDGDQGKAKSVANDGSLEETWRQDGDSLASGWSGMLPELLGEIIQRVEASEDKWPERKNVVVCGCVCKQWREATLKVVSRALVDNPGRITLPSSLKKPGPGDSPVQCIIRRDKKNASFCLYLSLTSAFTAKGKLLLAAQRYRNGPHAEYIISLDAEDFSQGSKAYVGKLRSDFLGTNFVIYDSQPPYNGAKPSSSKSGRRVANKQISPQVPSGNFEVGTVSYKFNLLKSRGPRRMVCSIKFPSSDTSTTNESQDAPKMKNMKSSSHEYTVLKNKAPRWHENLECWCLNFHGRVTVASVKNFQLVEATDPSQPDWKGHDEMVLLQFGKVGDDIFTMDYRHPLSAFQAFAICLTSFGTKVACE